MDAEETCDDGNVAAEDGCSPGCQVESGWTCGEAGKACAREAVCGDGVLARSEGCDDGNQLDGDGCAGNCSTVESGWQCRLPGDACVPLCGDGTITGTENCDDGNRSAGDGCSAVCLTEPGYSCDASGCVKSVCGNGKLEAGESCDAGAKNGLFFGDGSGCSKTCTAEPSCRNAAGETVACATKCGDGHVDPDEDCDDGNQFPADGCSADCRIEAGFECTEQTRSDVEDCSSQSGKCLKLPVTFRDFEPQGKSGGHPDFFWMGATSNGKKTVCVTNASGATASGWSDGGQCLNSDATANCTDLLANELGADGKPQLNPSSSLECNCRFTDWDQTGVLAGAPDASSCWVDGGGNRQRIQTKVRTITSAQSFGQWYRDSALSETHVRTLELPQVGSTSQYRFNSSGGNTVYEDLHNIFLNPTVYTTLTSGFFPLDSEAGNKYCNLWPYWVADSTCKTGSAIPTQWDPRGSYDKNSPNGTGGPIPGPGTNATQVIGKKRNFYFTSEARYLFRFGGGEVLVFDGDDDFWVYVNGRLVLDFGSPHERLRATMTLQANGSAKWKVEGLNISTGTWSQRDSGTVSGLSMTPGNTYEIAFFHADRHPRESNYQLTLSSFETNLSACQPDCGDGIRAAGEECDLGEDNDDSGYGGCTTECRYGPFCGDGIVNGNEECDLGRDNTTTYGAEGCDAACRVPGYCGNRIVEASFGETCDDGPNGSSLCTEQCGVRPR